MFASEVHLWFREMQGRNITGEVRVQAKSNAHRLALLSSSFRRESNVGFQDTRSRPLYARYHPGRGGEELQA